MAQTDLYVHRYRFRNKLNSAKFSKCFIDRARQKGLVSKGYSQAVNIQLFNGSL